MVQGAVATSTTFVLIPGAGGAARYWYLLVPELRKRGHEATVVDLPAADDAAGLEEYAQAVLAATRPDRTVVVVAQSMGAFTGPLVCEHRPVDMLVLVNPMIPQPGETAGEWWANTNHAEARRQQANREGRPSPGSPNDIIDAFFHDVPPAVREQIMSYGEPRQSGTPFGDPWPLSAWPTVPTRGIDVDEMPGGHLLALSQPAALADRLDAYWFELP